ncbi:MAG: diguanylate cyclase [Lachnospiraceae bacterium]|nr:diguanylate cyclase [Lachnospiraceae bacterium]
MKKNPFKWFSVFLITAAIVLSIIAYLAFGIDREHELNDRVLIAETVDKAVMDDLSEPITVSRMISQDSELIEMLEDEYLYDDDEMILNMRTYLHSIQKQFGFTSVYVISEASKKYYTYVGLNKIIDPEKDSFDTWYTIFLQGGKDYELESSTDQVNRDKLTVFVDGRVEDEAGTLLGVSGVGVETVDILDLLARYEEEYGVRIDYVSSDGLVQMSSRTDAVHSSYVSGIDLPDKTNDDYQYQPYGVDGFAVVRYVKELGWYMVVRSENSYETMGYNYRFFFAEILILMFTLAILFAGARNMRTESVMVQNKDKSTDSLTGLQNREYFIRTYGEKGTLNTTQYHSIAEFGIDNFDRIENSLREDRIILSVVRSARENFGLKGQIIRWNRSSFVVLFELSVEEAEEACRRFCRAVEEIGEVSVSVGLTPIELNDTLRKNYYRAVQNMYLVKELGGNNVKRG